MFSVMDCPTGTCGRTYSGCFVELRCSDKRRMSAIIANSSYTWHIASQLNSGDKKRIVSLSTGYARRSIDHSVITTKSATT